MAAAPRQFADFRAALKAAYEEEISGEAFFATLGRHFGGRAAEALELFAEIERVTEAAIAPVARRHGLPDTPRDALRAEGAAEAQAVSTMGWHGFLDHVIADYPAYVAEFTDLRDRAEGNDAAVLQTLVDHEQALLDFARAERDAAPDSFAPLYRYLSGFAAT